MAEKTETEVKETPKTEGEKPKTETPNAQAPKPTQPKTESAPTKIPAAPAKPVTPVQPAPEKPPESKLAWLWKPWGLRAAVATRKIANASVALLAEMAIRYRPALEAARRLAL